MLISGLQKLSLVDFDGEVSSTIFLAGCNFRCPFCHNFEFVVFDKDKLTTFKEEDVLEFIRERSSFMSGVAITGGEPTLNKDLKDLIIKIKKMGLKVKLDTNGTNPDMLIDLIENKLIDYVAIDVKNSKEKYSETIGLNDFDLSPIEKSFSYLLSHDFPYEFRTTLINPYHTKESIEEIGKWIKGARLFVLQHFVLSDHVPNRELKDIEEKNALEFKGILEKYVSKVLIRGY